MKWTRRRFLGTLPAAVAAQKVAGGVAFAAVEEDVTKYVKPQIGLGGHGHTYPGATVPWGAVQLSPDTGVEGWDHCSGYHYDDKSILGFSHTHLSGTGAADMLDFLLMPRVGEERIVPGDEALTKPGYRSPFSHDDEEMRPGYYKVKLADTGIVAELTATERVGVHRYTFPASDQAYFVLDLTHLTTGNTSKMIWSEIKIKGNDTLWGGRSTNLWSPGREIYFAMQFSKPFESVQIFSDDVPAGGTEVRFARLKAVVRFKTTAGEKIFVKTGISGISEEGAWGNVKAEVPSWDFDGVQAKAAASWKKLLSVAQVESTNQKHKEIFYTSLYHMLLAPTLFDDADGRYRGMDMQVHTLPTGLRNYSTFSLWDTYRTLHPMYTLIYPEKVPDLVNCLLREAEQSPEGVPVWPLQQRETSCMVGYHSAPVVAEAIVKGFPGIDPKRAYKLYRRRAMEDGYRGLDAYRKYGYVPCDVDDENTSKTMDYAYDDSAVAAMAKAAGETAEAELLQKRSKNYRNLYDPTVGFMRPKYKDGKWAGTGTFDPRAISITKKWRDYTEGNAWQTTFLVQHDATGLAELFGGKKALEEKLDGLFNANPELPPDMPPDVSGMVGQYAHGNEPSHHIAYLYNAAGSPEKTQKRVRSLMETMYDNKPNGMEGNEDCGQMSAWFVMSSLGFYPVDPVSAQYDLGTPLFDRVVLKTGKGRTLTIEAKRSSTNAAIVKRVTLNGKVVEGLHFAHADLVAGGHLQFEMGEA